MVSCLRKLWDLGRMGGNQTKLQKVMELNLPIRDAAMLSDIGGFYQNRERNLLRLSGWTYQNGYWMPPNH